MNHKCVICSSETEAKSDKKGRIFHFCKYCCFISLDPLFYLSPEQEKARYNMHNNTVQSDGYKKWLLSFINTAVKPFVEKGGSILDFGSGPTAVLGDLLILEGYSVDLYDKFFHDSEYYGSYDMITSTEVFEHISEPVSVLKQLKKSLKKNGYLSIKTAFHPEEEEEFLTWWYKEDKTHISFFSKETFLYISSLLDMSIHFCDYSSIIIFRN